MDWSKMFTSRVVVFGCGNVLYGDDGVGPACVAALEHDPELPEDVGLIDAGTSIRALLFDLCLGETGPDRVIVVDAITESGRRPGEVFEVDLDRMDRKKIPYFSMHQFPTTNLLKDLRDKTGTDVRVVVVQAESIPEAMYEGLSPAVRESFSDLLSLVKSLAMPRGSDTVR
ncbi:MAG: hydrogenase maturation protease [Deltaproteobacteria bacterium]|nr:hydrogenase maturation protease [Deltaproteobacteria bacterium]